MDQEKKGDCIGSCENLSQLREDFNGVVSETVIVKNSEEKICFDGENVDLRLQIDGFGSFRNHTMDFRSDGDSSSLVDGNVLKNGERDFGEKSNVVATSEGSVEASGEETNEIRGVVETLGQVYRGSSGSLDNSVGGFVFETNVVISTQEAACVEGGNGEFKVKDSGLGSSKVSAEEPKRKVAEAEESCVIDMKGSGGGQRQFSESWDGERVCRICHLNLEQSLESTDSISTTEAAMDLIQLGCGCKDELGIAHSHCAEAWFKLKGNRICEICGQTAKNIRGIRDSRFLQDWHGQGSTSDGTTISERHAGCWHGQPFCNFLMACLVMAFVLPWFFRVNMF